MLIFIEIPYRRINYFILSEKYIFAAMSKFTGLSSQENDTRTPNPGEIWEISRCVQSPLSFFNLQQQNLYSETAQKFIEGKSPPRYVMIVSEPEQLVDSHLEWQEVSVMMLSEETYFLSHVDLLIPKEVSGLEKNLIAETWHVLPMLTCNLLQPVGQRLSREIYDVLMTVGDYYHSLVDEIPSTKEIHTLGLQIANVAVNQEFHHQEEAWSDVLNVPLAASRVYLKGIKLTEELLNNGLTNMST